MLEHEIEDTTPENRRKQEKEKQIVSSSSSSEEEILIRPSPDLDFLSESSEHSPHSINSDGHLNASSKQILAYIKREMAPDKAISKAGLIIPTSLGLGAGIAAGIPFGPGGLKLAGDNKILGYLYAGSGSGINMALYWPFCYDIIKSLVTYFSTPKEFKDLIVRKHNRSVYVLASAVLTSFAAASVIPYIGLSEETDSPTWILALNIAANLIGHGKAFLLAASSDNFLGYRHLWEPLTYARLALFSNMEKDQYLENLKTDFVLKDLYKNIFNNFQQVLASYGDNADFEALFQEVKTAKPYHPVQRAAGNFSGFMTSLLTFVTVTGYLIGTFLILKDHSFSNPYLATIFSIMLTSFANFFFLYLIGRSTFDIGNSVFNLGVDLVKTGWKNYEFPAWFRRHEKKSLAILTVFLAMAALSFPSGVYLIKENFPQIGLGGSWVEPFAVYTSIAITGAFNGVGLPGVLKMGSETVTLIKKPREKNSSENEGLLKSEDSTANHEAQMRRDYKAHLALEQLSRLDEHTFLLFFLQMVKEHCPGFADSVVATCSNNQLKGSDELEAFLDHKTIPKAYQRIPATFFGRSFQCYSSNKNHDRPDVIIEEQRENQVNNV